MLKINLICSQFYMLGYLKKERETKTSFSTLPRAFVKLYNEGSLKQIGKCSNVTTIQLPSHCLGSATQQVSYSYLYLRSDTGAPDPVCVSKL